MQDEFLSKFFASSIRDDFYLTGGTALARYYFLDLSQQLLAQVKPSDA